MNFKQRSYQKELLDSDAVSFEDIRQNMKELDTINTLLGGHTITLRGLQKLVGNRKKITICEIGCGGGDNLAAVVKWCALKTVQVAITGIDIKETCIKVAKEHPLLKSKGRWIVDDYAGVQFEELPDIIFSSLFCHHFTDEQLVFQLQWMQKNSRLGFFINDLHRAWPAYYAIKLLTQVFSRSRLVKNDAPLSVARGFTKKEWLYLFARAGLQVPVINWQWAFRHLIISKLR